MKVNPGRKRFGTPIEVGTTSTSPNNSPSVDESIDRYLQDKKKRTLEEAKMADLESAKEGSLLQAARMRKEKERVDKGEITGEEGDMETSEKKIEDAAEVAAEAASAGVDPEQAKDLGAGKKKVVVIKPEGGKEASTEGGWSVVDGKPVKDPEGEYSFSQALKVASIERGKTGNESTSILKWLKEEGLLAGSKGDEFMNTFMKELAQKSVDSIVKSPGSGGSSDVEALRSDLNSLRVELKTATDPVESANRVKSMYESWKTIGLIKEPETPIYEGEPLEVVKEKHRHDEKIEELKADREYKQELTKIASELPERVGRGIGGQISEEEESRGHSGDGGLESFICPEEGCGARIYITPETGGQVTCPKCKSIYSRTGSVETKEE